MGERPDAAAGGASVSERRRAYGRAWLRAFGWRAEGALPAGVDKAVFIAAPHTSNWDGPHMIAVAWALGVPLGWMGKQELFRPPFGGFLRSVGGVSVDRRRPEGVVSEVAAAFAASERMFLAIAPSGTRRGKDHWKSGFYRIALGAGVPIVMGYLDYARRAGGCGPVLVPSGDVRADMDRIRAFYADVAPRHPARLAGVRLREEARAEGDPADGARDAGPEPRD